MSVASRRRGRAGALALLACILAGAACGGPGPPATLRVGVPGTLDDLPYHVMQAEGFDRAENLRLELSVSPGGAQALDALATGRLDVSSGIGSIPLLTAAAAGVVPARAVAIAGNTVADPEHPSNAILVGAGVRSWADLRGQLVGVHNPDSLAGAAAVARLRQEGVVGYRLVTAPLPNLGLAVASGTVAAASMSEPFVTQAVLRGDGRVLAWIVGGPPLERMVVTLTVARTELYRVQRDTVRRLLRAFLRAVDWIDAHPEDARAMAAARLGITDELGQKLAMLRWPVDARVDRRLFAEQQAVLVGAGLLARVIPAEAVVDEGVLEEVLGARP